MVYDYVKLLAAVFKFRNMNSGKISGFNFHHYFRKHGSDRVGKLVVNFSGKAQAGGKIISRLGTFRNFGLARKADLYSLAIVGWLFAVSQPIQSLACECSFYKSVPKYVLEVLNHSAVAKLR